MLHGKSWPLERFSSNFAQHFTSERQARVSENSLPKDPMRLVNRILFWACFVLPLKGKVGQFRSKFGDGMDTVQILQSPGNVEARSPAVGDSEMRLQDLLPIAMVIVGGCESCAERMVERALAQGSSLQDVDKTLRIVAGMQKLDCFANSVGPDVISHMEKPLQAGRRTLERAIRSSANNR